MSAVLSWLAANIGTIVICAIIVAIVVLLVWSLIRDKKKGKTCCGGCSGCSMSGVCHSKKEKE